MVLKRPFDYIEYNDLIDSTFADSRFQNESLLDISWIVAIFHTREIIFESNTFSRTIDVKIVKTDRVRSFKQSCDFWEVDLATLPYTCSRLFETLLQTWSR